MSRIDMSPNEPIDGALRRLKKKVEREGVLKVLKARKYYEKPSEKKRRKMRTVKKHK